MINTIAQLQVKSYKGRAIRINEETHYVCLTDMAIASGKRYYDWSQLKGTIEYLVEFSVLTGILVDDLITTSDNTVANEHRGTWGHPKVAIRFAQWCNVKFAIQVDFWIDELLTTGRVELVPEIPVSKELLIKQSKVVAQCIDDIQNILSKSNPRLAQLLIDIGVNDFVESNQRQLPTGSTEFPEDRWHSLVSIADKMDIKTNSSTRTSLGLFVGKIGLERVREERLCNGEMRQIWCYRDNSETRQAIDDWADSISEN